MVDIGYNGIETNREGMRQADGPNLKDHLLYQPDNCDDGKGRLLLWPNNGRGCYFGILIENYRQKKNVLEVDYQILFYGPWMGIDELDKDLVTGQESRRATFAPNPAGSKYPFRILSNQVR